MRYQTPAALTDVIRAAGIPSVLVTVDPDGETGAWSYADPCTGTARIEIGAELLDQPNEVRLAGALAHEAAHLVLGHTKPPTCWDARAVAIAALVSAAAGAPWWVLLVGLVGATVLHLVDLMGQRREEIAADAFSVTLLDAAGLPGREIVAATLAQIPDDTRWYRAVGWVVGSYPTATSRRAALAR